MAPFAWPIAVVVIVIFAFVFFRKEIKNILNRTKKLKIFGVAASVQREQKAFEEQSQVLKILNKFDSQLVLDYEKLIKERIELDEIKIPSERESYLLKLLARAVINGTFEMIYSQIFGTQLRLLEDLNQKSSGESKSNLKKYYDEYSTMFNLPDPASYDSYFGFLQSWDLIKITGDNVAITLQGRELLLYIVSSGKNKENLF